MERNLALCAGMGLGAGLMYLLDPEQGRGRRATAGNQVAGWAGQADRVVQNVADDVKSHASRMASGDFSDVTTGWRDAFEDGGWTPTARAMMALAGGGMFLYGLTQSAPAACIFGTIGLVMMGEGISSVGVGDIRRASNTVTERATNLVQSMKPQHA